MFMRIDKLQAELPAPKKADPNAGAALQELLGGKYGEMSTLGNYMFQSFNFRSKSKLKPFYELVAAITAEELGHVELVSNGVALLNNGPDSAADDSGDGGDISMSPFEAMKEIRSAASFFSASSTGVLSFLPWLHFRQAGTTLPLVLVPPRATGTRSSRRSRKIPQTSTNVKITKRNGAGSTRPSPRTSKL